MFKRWLQPIAQKPSRAYCKICKRELAAVVTALKKHCETAYHKEKVSVLVDPTLNRIDSMLVGHSVDGRVRDAEIRMASFISEHNLSFNVMDHFSDLLPTLCPDSEIAAHFKCKRTKAKSIVNNALSPHFHEEHVRCLQNTHFSVIIDETTDVSTCKELAIVTRHFDKHSSKVQSQLYDLVSLPQADAETTYQTLVSSIEKDKISLKNVIGFAADTCNVMFGEHNSVASRLKENIPNIFLMRCICHSAHLCASHACEKLPRTAEELMRDVYNYFSNSAKRQEQFKIVQHFCDMEPHRLLRPCQTRWLSLHSCVSRLIEQWDALIQFFQAVAGRDNLLMSQKTLSLLQNPIWKLYFYFLEFVLPKFTELNTMFQSSKPSVHCLHRGLSATYRELLSCYLTEAYWKSVSLKDIDPTSRVNFLPLPRMYMGAKITLCLPKDEYKQRPADVQYFLKSVQEFYIEAASQVKKRFPIGDPIVEMLQVLDPAASHAKFPSLVPLASNFPNIIPMAQLQTLDDQWRRLSHITLPFDSEDMDPEEFWGRLEKITDGAGDSQFSVLCDFMQNMLCLPHANVDVERVFSSVTAIKTKTRNRLHTTTVRSLIKVKDGIKKSGGCVKFSPPQGAKERMSSAILYSDASVDASHNDHEQFDSDL